jgi:hypothetical protein
MPTRQVLQEGGEPLDALGTHLIPLDRPARFEYVPSCSTTRDKERDREHKEHKDGDDRRRRSEQDHKERGGGGGSGAKAAEVGEPQEVKAGKQPEAKAGAKEGGAKEGTDKGTAPAVAVKVEGGAAVKEEPAPAGSSAGGGGSGGKAEAADPYEPLVLEEVEGPLVEGVRWSVQVRG